MIVGTDFFQEKELKNIRVTNVKDVVINKHYFEPLIGLTMSNVKVQYQARFEKDDDGVVTQVGGPLGGNRFYVLPVDEVITLLKKEQKDSNLWEELKYKEAILITTACEVIE